MRNHVLGHCLWDTLCPRRRLISRLAPGLADVARDLPGLALMRDATWDTTWGCCLRLRCTSLVSEH